jgi:alkylation response protein AidB-like acyl-CoA dehydrogenase
MTSLSSMNPLPGMGPLSALAIGILRGYAAGAERAGRLQPEQLDLIYEQGWFRMMVPRRYGGLALSLPEVVRLEEAISEADGSAGWAVTLCSGAGWFTGFFPPSALTGVFSDPRLCIAGSGTPSGRAQLIPGGYRVSGRWSYASGAHHATAFTANCTVWSDDQPVKTAAGVPLVQPFLFLREEVNILEDWKAMGMVATGSHGFEVHGLEVPAERGFVIDASAAADDDPLYRYPFVPLAEATLAVNIGGMMCHFLACCSALFSERIGRRQLSDRNSAEMMDALDAAHGAVKAARVEFYSALDDSWTKMQPESFARVGRASHALTSVVREWSDRLFPYAGLGAARMDAEINRVWRDMHTAGQHPLLVFGAR